MLKQKPQGKENLDWQLADAQQAEMRLKSNDTQNAVIVDTDGQLIINIYIATMQTDLL